MTKKRIHFVVLIFCSLLCLVMLLDASVMPSTSTSQVITEGRQRSTLSGGRLYQNYFISTAGKEYEVRKGFYAKAQKGQLLILQHSILTGVPQKIMYRFNDVIYSENMGFAREPVGFVFLCFMLLFAVSVMLFYKRITFAHAHTNVCIFIGVVTFVLFYFHFR